MAAALVVLLLAAVSAFGVSADKVPCGTSQCEDTIECCLQVEVPAFKLIFNYCQELGRQNDVCEVKVNFNFISISTCSCQSGLTCKNEWSVDLGQFGNGQGGRCQKK